MVTFSDINLAYRRIRPYTFHTPLTRDILWSQELGCDLYIKWENTQISGSFKARGAFNKILSIPADKRRQSFFVAASTGNHAAAFCTALNTLKIKGKVFLPKNVSKSKLAYIEATKVPYELYGSSSLQAELRCRQVADEQGFVMVHPYNDSEIVAGQGTCALEILNEIDGLDSIIVPVGGGGLISGIATVADLLCPAVRVVGCQPSQSPEMVRSVELGRIIEEDISKPTLSDGTAGGMEPGSITFAICQQKVSEWALIEEDAIAFEVIQMLLKNQTLIEGAAALSLAYLRQHQDRYRGKKVASIVTGKRIGPDTLRKLLDGV